MVPSPSGSDDAVGVGGPDERLGSGIVLGEVAIDRGLEVDQRMEHATLQPTAGELGEEGLDRVEPGGRGRGVVEGPAGMPLEPGADLDVLGATVVVEDDVDELAGRDLAFQAVQEP